MRKQFISEKLRADAPISLTNFLWYLCELYCPDEKETVFKLQKSDSDSNLQIITICSANQSISKNFGSHINATIIVTKKDTGCYMSYKE